MLDGIMRNIMDRLKYITTDKICMGIFHESGHNWMLAFTIFSVIRHAYDWHAFSQDLPTCGDLS